MLAGARSERSAIPLTIFDCRGIRALSRERIDAGLIARGRHRADLCEGWIAIDPFRGEVRVIITGSFGFERRAAFAVDEEPAEIIRSVREATADEF